MSAQQPHPGGFTGAPLRAKQDVVRFQVAVHNALRMHVLQAQCQLSRQGSGDGEIDAPGPAGQVPVQIKVHFRRCQDHTLSPCEDPLQRNDVRMRVQRAPDLDLARRIGDGRRPTT